MLGLELERSVELNGKAKAPGLSIELYMCAWQGGV